MMSENISGIVAQRLVRKLCPKCKLTREITSQESEVLERVWGTPLDTTTRIAEARGCDHCRGTGYRGRLAVTEVLAITPELDELISADATRGVLRKQAVRDGFRSMVVDGITKVLRHETSLDELRRAVDMTRVA